MTDTAADQPRRRIHNYLLPAGGTLVIVAGLALGLYASRSAPPPTEDKWPTTLIDVPVVVAPPFMPVRTVSISPNALVIGVSVGTKHRAYRIDGMSQSRSHAVNDLIGGNPVTVVYCDRTGCARGFTAEDRYEPLDIAVGGWLNADGVQDMLVRVGAHRYQLKTGQPMEGQSPEFPYEELDVRLTTWEEWRSAHPDTDVYYGSGTSNHNGG
jgi:Protein of unknown function (DUF3179)